MSGVLVISLLFAAGFLVLIAELFVPSHGILTVVAIGLLIAGIVETFRYGGQRAGAISVVACLIALPSFAAAAIKIWPKTWIGRKIAPANPVVTARDTTVPVEELSRYIGATGKALSTLRPVGICEFNGRRISCVAEFGMVETGAEVEGLRISGANLAVQTKKA